MSYLSQNWPVSIKESFFLKIMIFSHKPIQTPDGFQRNFRQLRNLWYLAHQWTLLRGRSTKWTKMKIILGIVWIINYQLYLSWSSLCLCVASVNRTQIVIAMIFRVALKGSNLSQSNLARPKIRTFQCISRESSNRSLWPRQIGFKRIGSFQLLDKCLLSHVKFSWEFESIFSGSRKIAGVEYLVNF